MMDAVTIGINRATELPVAEGYAKRNLAIDMFRGLTMFLMIFVNDLWKIHDVPHWLEHAAYGEDFMGLADIVFPCFLFAVGMSIPYAIANRRRKGLSAESTLGHILSRTFALLVMGAFIGNSEARLSPDSPYPIGVYWFLMVAGFICVWNAYPRTDSKRTSYLYTTLKAIGVGILLYLALSFRNSEGGVFSFHTGILGLIGWCYLICSVIYMLSGDKLRNLIAAWGVFMMICLLTTPLREEYGGNPILNFGEGNFLDSFLWSIHVGNGGLCCCVMGGIVISALTVRLREYSETKKLVWSIIAGAVFLTAGIIAHKFFIVSKIGDTPVWILYVTAISVAGYGLLTWLVKHDITSWFNIIRPAGTATLTAYIIPYFMYGLSDVTGYVLPDALTHGFVGLLNCACFSLIVIGIVWVIGKFKIKLKI